MRKTVLLIASMVLALSVVALVANAEPVGAAFPGQNGAIVFYSDRTTGEGVDNPTGDYEVFTVNPDGSGLQQITRNTTYERDPAYSPDGTKIVFVRGRDIWRMDADGSGETQLTDTPRAFDEAPVFSPSGEKVAFSRGFEDEGQFQISRAEILKMDALDGSDVVRLTNTPDLIESSADWSPDGKKIAFDTRRSRRAGSGPPAAIYKINASDGSARTCLTGANLSPSHPSWSPKGARIAFSAFSTQGTGYSDIYRMKPDGSRVQRLTSAPGFDSGPAWSPDGAEIAFSTDRLGNSRDPIWNIFRMKADGSEETSVTSTPAQDALSDWQPIP